VVVSGAATAIALAGPRNLTRWLTELTHGPRPTPQAQVRPVSRAMRHPEPAIVESPPGPATAPASIEVTPAPATANANRPARRPAALPTKRRDGDSELVVQAMRALRRNDDAALARALSARYLELHPGGPLAEEALALTIEAAVAQHAPDAPTLGAHYLRQYPNGPFRGLARQASHASGADSR
jgi:hypothetical protein